jgi:hypothetical protein
LGNAALRSALKMSWRLRLPSEMVLLGGEDVAVPYAKDADRFVLGAEQQEEVAEVSGGGFGEVDGVVGFTGEDGSELETAALGGLPVCVEGVDFIRKELNLGVGVDFGLGELLGEAAGAGGVPEAVGRVVEMREIVGGR